MAIWAGIAGGAAAYGKQQDQAQEDQRWQQRYAQTQAMQAQQERARARYIAALSPPKTDALHTTDEAGKPIVQNREWIPPSDEDIAAGRAGSFKVTGSTPDINFEKLDERERHNREQESAAQERLRMQGEVNAARMEAAAAKGGGQGRYQELKAPDGTSRIGFVDKGGVFHEAKDEQGNPLSSSWYRHRQGAGGSGNPKAQTIPLTNGTKYKANAADDIGPASPADEYAARPTGADMPQSNASPRITIVDPGADRPPMGQFAGGKPAASHGKIVRTGKKNGRRVVMYEDGTIADAP